MKSLKQCHPQDCRTRHNCTRQKPYCAGAPLDLTDQAFAGQVVKERGLPEQHYLNKRFDNIFPFSQNNTILFSFLSYQLTHTHTVLLYNMFYNLLFCYNNCPIFYSFSHIPIATFSYAHKLGTIYAQ